jgi:exodeoxyribonuclease-3
MADTIDVLSWNVNGLRAASRAGFGDWLARCGAAAVAVQEVRARPEQLDPALHDESVWHLQLASAERPGYSGVGLFARRRPDEVVVGVGPGAAAALAAAAGGEAAAQAPLGAGGAGAADDAARGATLAAFDAEGRALFARFGDLWIVSLYVPNGSGRARGNERVPFKLAFMKRVFDMLEPLRAAGRPVLVAGDFNTAFAALDLARPAANVGTSGFLPEERAALGGWFAAGWVDTFRALYPEREGAYSWWSQRFGVRERNVGWRIDLVLASAAAMAEVEDAYLLPDQRGSDHCPVGVRLRRPSL